MEPSENIPLSEVTLAEKHLKPEQRAQTRAREGLYRYINPDKDLTAQERPVFDKMFKLAEQRALQEEREAQGRDPIEFICQALIKIADKDTKITDDDRLLLKAKASEWRRVQESLQAKWGSLKAIEHSGGEVASSIGLFEAFVPSHSIPPQIDLTTGYVMKEGKQIYVEGTNHLAISILNELGVLAPGENLEQRVKRAEKEGSGDRLNRDPISGTIKFLQSNSPQIGEGIYSVVYTPGISHRPKTHGQNITDIRLVYGTLTGPDYRTPVANAMVKSVR